MQQVTIHEREIKKADKQQQHQCHHEMTGQLKSMQRRKDQKSGKIRLLFSSTFCGLKKKLDCFPRAGVGFHFSFHR